jgi:hypothetical protein
VFDPFDPYGRDRRAFDRRKQCTADRVSDRGTESSFEGLSVKLAIPFRQSFGLNVQTTRHLKICPIIALCHSVLFKMIQRLALSPGSSEQEQTFRAPDTSANRQKLLAVKLNDKLFVDILIDVLSGGQTRDRNA